MDAKPKKDGVNRSATTLTIIGERKQMVGSFLSKSVSAFVDAFSDIDSEDDYLADDRSGKSERMTLYGDMKMKSKINNSFYVPRHLRYAGRLQPQRLFAFRMIRSPYFDVITGLVIVVNAICIGIEQLSNPDGVQTNHTFEILETIFLTIYWCELLLRFFAIGPRCIKDNWIKIDLFLVVVGTSAIFLSNIETLAKLLVLRAARLLRIARTARLLIKFRELWMLIKGMSGSLTTMSYTTVLLVMMMYIFSCMGVELITRHPMNIGPHPDPQFQELVSIYFSDLPQTMLTLVQFVTGDSMSAVYLPFIKLDFTLAIYFFSLVMLICIVMMNLVTAVIVNSALEEASKDKEMQKVQVEQERKNLISDMSALFERLDIDVSGTLSIEELEKICGDDRSILTRACMSDDLGKIFKALDVDGEGLLSIEDFCDGVYKMNVAKKPMEMQRMERQLEGLYKMMHGNMALQREMCKCISRMTGEGTHENYDMERALEFANSLLKRQYSHFDKVRTSHSDTMKATISNNRPSAAQTQKARWEQELAEVARAASHLTSISIEKLRSELAGHWGLVAAALPTKPQTAGLSRPPFQSSTKSCSLLPSPTLDSLLGAPAWAKELADAVQVDANLTNMSIEQICNDLVEQRKKMDLWSIEAETPLTKPSSLGGDASVQGLSD